MAFQLAMMGACVVLAVLDPYHNRLHIATTGDSRAIMGTWNPEVQLWDVSQLSEDQTSVNPKEAKRLTSEHPPREAPEILKDGRTFGLGPSRAFGDAMFKWPRDAIRNVSRMIYPTPYEPIPEAKTPPYVTARPEVTSREILPEDALEQGMRRFIVLGTDELYETLSNSEIVGLVGGALQTEPPKGEIAKEAIRETTQLAAHPEGTYFSEPGYGRNYKFIFKDQNLATHVIRNSIAGSHTKLLQTLLGLPKELSRNYRDDVGC
ncbi:phosphatase 2C-like domain-containing protein [Auriculariales sp. MPI-PUGE-AT-0066]|nr:phosphatase 2C-like domain-containing protein [Auriculariales sp. MPI-PUGE-AT-0066]